MDILLGLALSAHIGFENNYNAIHPHIRLQQNELIGGAYFNSEYNLSTYAGLRFEHNSYGFEIGVVTGYEESAVMPYVRGTYNDLFVAPALENNEVKLVFGVEIPIK